MALLVAIGYTQLTCINFTETYSPVARFTSTIRILLSLTVQLGLKAYQMNLETSFMYADLVEEMYVALALGYDTPGYVWRLFKALYGLEQSLRVGTALLTTI